MFSGRSSELNEGRRRTAPASSFLEFEHVSPGNMMFCIHCPPGLGIRRLSPLKLLSAFALMWRHVFEEHEEGIS
jgi:hypothetical protein